MNSDRDFVSIGRADVAKLLDKIELENRARTATYVLQVFSGLANWYSARDDNYHSPIVRGMRRGSATKRERILTDDELVKVWKAERPWFRVNRRKPAIGRWHRPLARQGRLRCVAWDTGNPCLAYRCGQHSRSFHSYPGAQALRLTTKQR